MDDPFRSGTRIDLNVAENSITGNDYVAALFAAAEALDTKDVHSTNRYCVCHPDMYYSMIQSDRAVNQDFNNSDNGSYAGGNIARMAGFTIIPSNHIAQGDKSVADTGVQGQTWNGAVRKAAVDMRETKSIVLYS